MRFATVGYIVGVFAVSFGSSMVFSVAWGLWFGEYRAVWSLVGAMGVSIALGLTAIFLLRRRRQAVGPREGFAVAAVGWVVLAGLGALPFWFGGHIPSYLDCYFESMSGLTTTGSSILTARGGELPTDIESLPKALLFWRSFTQWLGGMGIIVLSLALLPMPGVGGMQIYRAEVPGPTADKLVPRVRQTAKLLWSIYALLSLVLCVLLWAHPAMTLFDAMCHTLATMATGGFSTHSASIAHFDSLYVDMVLTVFMFFAGTSFALHYLGLRGRLRAYVGNAEWRFYACVAAVSVLGLAVLLAVGGGLSPAAAGRHAAFQVVSILTTTGFTTADFSLWPAFSGMWLVMLMFFGGCAGSTGGGMKNVRVVLTLKHAASEMKRLVHPQAVIVSRLGGKPVPSAVMQSVLGFVVLYMVIFVVASLAMGLVLHVNGPDDAPGGQGGAGVMVTAVSAVAATLNNIGPGLGGVGPGEWQAYSWIPAWGKVILTLCMLVGRLEVFTVVLLLTPWFYR